MKKSVTRILVFFLLIMIAFNTFCYANMVAIDEDLIEHVNEVYLPSFYIVIIISVLIIAGISAFILMAVYKLNKLDKKNEEDAQIEEKNENNQ